MATGLTGAPIHAGSWLGLPDLGFTEKLQSLFAPNKPLTSQGGSNLLGSYAATPSSSPSPSPTPSSIQVNKAQTTSSPAKSSGGGGGGGGGTTISDSEALAKGWDVNNLPAGYTRAGSGVADIDAQKAQEAALEQQRIAEERTAISSEFEPVFNELDRQIGLLPEQKQTYLDQINSLATSQKGEAQTQQEQNTKTLEGAKGDEVTRAKEGFRTLEEDIRNQLAAKQFYFGALGAGDSSAPGMASEAVTKEGLKARATIMSGRDQSLSLLDSKIGDVNNLATTQLGKIDTWKSDKLFQVTTDFTDKLNELNTNKANASAEKAKAINDVIRGLHQDFLTRLRQLDDATTNYKTSVATWQQQRAAELEDYKTKLGIAAQYSSTTGPTYQNALDLFNKLYGTQNLSTEQARQAVLSETGIDPLAGLTLSSDQSTKKKTSFADQILGDSLSSTSQ